MMQDTTETTETTEPYLTVQQYCRLTGRPCNEQSAKARCRQLDRICELANLPVRHGPKYLAGVLARYFEDSGGVLEDVIARHRSVALINQILAANPHNRFVLSVLESSRRFPHLYPSELQRYWVQYHYGQAPPQPSWHPAEDDHDGAYPDDRDEQDECPGPTPPAAPPAPAPAPSPAPPQAPAPAPAPPQAPAPAPPQAPAPAPPQAPAPAPPQATPTPAADDGWVTVTEYFRSIGRPLAPGEAGHHGRALRRLCLAADIVPRSGCRPGSAKRYPPYIFEDYLAEATPEPQPPAAPDTPTAPAHDNGLDQLRAEVVALRAELQALKAPRAETPAAPPAEEPWLTVTEHYRSMGRPLAPGEAGIHGNRLVPFCRAAGVVRRRPGNHPAAAYTYPPDLLKRYAAHQDSRPAPPPPPPTVHVPADPPPSPTVNDPADLPPPAVPEDPWEKVDVVEPVSGRSSSKWALRPRQQAPGGPQHTVQEFLTMTGCRPEKAQAYTHARRLAKLCRAAGWEPGLHVNNAYVFPDCVLTGFFDHLDDLEPRPLGIEIPPILRPDHPRPWFHAPPAPKLVPVAVSLPGRPGAKPKLLARHPGPHMTIMAWCASRGRPMTHEQAQPHGAALSRRCREAGCLVRKVLVPDLPYPINDYPVCFLVEHFADVDRRHAVNGCAMAT